MGRRRGESARLPPRARDRSNEGRMSDTYLMSSILMATQA